MDFPDAGVAAMGVIPLQGREYVNDLKAPESRKDLETIQKAVDERAAQGAGGDGVHRDQGGLRHGRDCFRGRPDSNGGARGDGGEKKSDGHPGRRHAAEGGNARAGGGQGCGDGPDFGEGDLSVRGNGPGGDDAAGRLGVLAGALGGIRQGAGIGGEAGTVGADRELDVSVGLHAHRRGFGRAVV